MVREKTLIDPYPYWDEDEMKETLNQRVEPLYDSLTEYYEEAHDGDQLDYFEIELHSLKYSYIKEGSCFYHIWKDCLWQGKASSFSAYCKNEFGLRWYQVKSKVDASRIASMLLANGFNILPTSQYQCKVLQLLENVDIVPVEEETPYERIIKIWQKVTEDYKPENITGKVIRNVIASTYPEFIPERTKADVSLEINAANQLFNQAMEEGTSQSQLILDMLRDRRISLGYEISDDDEVEEIDIDMNMILQESILFNQLRLACERIRLSVNQVLEFISREENLSSLVAKGYFKAKEIVSQSHTLMAVNFN